MSGPLARVIAQLMVTGAGIVSRAFVAAYSQAVQNARTGTQQQVKSMTRTSKMSTAEALQVLNLSKAEMDPTRISQQFARYFESNDPNKGGSFYLQSKVFRARESLHETLELAAKREEQEKAEAAASAAAAKAAGGGAGAGAGASAQETRQEGKGGPRMKG